MFVYIYIYIFIQRFAENLQIKRVKNETAHVQYLKDQRKNWKKSLFAFLEVARTLQTAVCLGTSSKSACPHATCTMHYSMIQFKEKIQWYNQSMDQQRDQCLQRRRERERASETAEKKEDWLRMPNVLQLLRLQIGPEVLQTHAT